MKNIRLIAVLMAVIMLLTMLSACGESADKKDNGKDKFLGGSVSSEKDSDETDNDEDSDNDNSNSNDFADVDTTVSYDKMPESISAYKIGSISPNSVNVAAGGVYYIGQDGKYGIMSFDGKSDTGAKYAYCEGLGNYFKVQMTDSSSVSDVASLNYMGVVDVHGNEIIPMQYAHIKVLNDRYIRVCEVTEQTDNKDEALLYFTEDIFSLDASDEDTLLKGNWYIYDVKAGKMLDGVTGTLSYDAYAYGDFVKYTNDNQESFTVNHMGQPLPDGATLFDNGFYRINSGNNGVVYNSVGEKLFEYTLDGFAPTYVEEEYIVAAKYEGSVRKYVLMDYAGNVVSAEFTDMPSVMGDLIHVGEQIYDFEGNVVLEGTFKNAYYEDQLGFAWFLKNDTQYTLIDKEGNILYQGVEEEGTYYDYFTSFTVKKSIDSVNTYYCLKDGDFTIKATSYLGPWMVIVNNPDYSNDVVDVISGQTIISGYSRYSYVDLPNSAIYVYAQKSDGGVDIYCVK